MTMNRAMSDERIRKLVAEELAIKGENLFVREVYGKDIREPLDILNWYRNLYYKEGLDTERGLMANTINDLFMQMNTKTERMSEKELTTDAAIQYLESIIYEDFAPYTQKCLLKVIEAARKAESMTADWEKRMERIVERLENMKLIRVEQCHEDYELELITEGHFDDAIEIVKGGGADE